MITILLSMAIFWGIGNIIPRAMPDYNISYGLQTHVGMSFVIIVVFILQILGIGLVHSGVIIVILGAIGFVHGVRDIRHGIVFHPILVIPIISLLLIILHGGVAYQPLAWDELGGWLIWAKEALMLDSVFDKTNNSPYYRVGYTPGWPIIIAFPNFITYSNLDEAKSAIMPFLIHIGLLGLVYDFIIHYNNKYELPKIKSTLIAWTIILLALTAEATWKLAPTNLLIEKPQIYFISSCIFVGLLLNGANTNNHRIGLVLGILFTAGYLIKVSMLAFAGPLLVLCLIQIWPITYQNIKGLITGGSIFVVVFIIWKIQDIPQGCMSSPTDVMVNMFNDNSLTGRYIDLLGRFINAELEYLGNFKLPLTILSIFGMIISLFSRFKAAAIAIFAYVMLYFLALYAYHLGCFGEYYFYELNSIDRFTRVPLRVFHLCGVIFLALLIIPKLSPIIKAEQFSLVLGIIVAILGIWQVVQLNNSFESMATRYDASESQLTMVKKSRKLADTAALLVKENPRLGRNVLVVAQETDGYAQIIIQYFSIGKFKVLPNSSWGEKPVNLWMQKTTPEEMRSQLLQASLVVPVVWNDWLKEIVSGMGITDCFSEGELMIPEPETQTLRCLRP